MTYDTGLTKICNFYFNIFFFFSNWCMFNIRETPKARIQKITVSLSMNISAADIMQKKITVRGGGGFMHGEVKSVDCSKQFLCVVCGVTTNKRIPYSLSEEQKLRLPEATQLYGRLIMEALMFSLFFQLKENAPCSQLRDILTVKKYVTN